MDDCEGCCIANSRCFIEEIGQKELCPCTICLVKTKCKSVLDICEKYETVLKHCHTIKDGVMDE